MAQEQYLNTEKTGLLLPVLAGVSQLIPAAHSGRACMAKEITDMADKTGITKLGFRSMLNTSPFIMITGKKP